VLVKRYVLTNMRTTRSFTMVAAVIAAGFLVLATISGAAFATCSNGHGGDTSGGGGGTSATSTSSISQSNTQSATCTAGTSNTGSCNQVAINWNTGNAVSAAQAASDPVPGFPTVSATAGSSISQSNIQTATCTAGTFNDHSCNQAAANVNFGNAVSAALASFGR
jgi:hypothetical protein